MCEGRRALNPEQQFGAAIFEGHPHGEGFLYVLQAPHSTGCDGNSLANDRGTVSRQPRSVRFLTVAACLPVMRRLALEWLFF
jgi:hypothetical protein